MPSLTNPTRTQTGSQMQTSRLGATALTCTTRRAAQTALLVSGHGRLETLKVGARVRLCAAARRRKHSSGAIIAPAQQAGSAESSVKTAGKLLSLMTVPRQPADVRRGELDTKPL